MIPKAVTLFLAAAAVVSGRVAHGPSHHQMVLMPALSRGCPSALEPAPLICKFLQPDLEYHYKPQLIAPSTYIPPLVVEKCDHSEMDIEIPAPIKPVVIPEAPVLPPITIPKFPVPVMIEKSLPPVPVVEPCEPAFIPETRALPEMAHQEFYEVAVPEVPYQPLVVPQPPVLPEFVMPDLPVRVEMPMAEPCLDDQLIPAPVPEFVPAPMPLPIAEHAFVQEAIVPSIPAAPELPPFEMPSLPEIVLPEPVVSEIPQQPLVVPQPPELRAVEMPELPVRVELPIAEPCLEDHLIPAPEFIPYEPAFLPEIPVAPVLPPFEMPILPEIVTKPELPVPSFQPIAVPHAPELPTFVMPELPIRVEAPEPCLEDQLIPVAAPEYIPPPVTMPLPVAGSFKPAAFVAPETPMPPVLPPFKMPALPEIVAPEPAVAPYTPELPAVMPPMIAPCPEDLLPIVSIPEYIRPLPMPVPELPKPVIPFEIPYQPMWNPMIKLDPCLNGVEALTPQLPLLQKSVEMPLMPAHPADLPYFMRYPSYSPSVHGAYYNHLPRMGAHMRYVL